MVNRLHPLLLVMMLLSGCFGFQFETETARTEFEVDQWVVRETVIRTDSFPDPTFERIYAVSDGGRWREIGRFEDEGGENIRPERPPELVEPWLVVYADAHLFLWRPEDNSAIHFSPYDAEGWSEFSQRQFPSLNGSYDVRVDQFSIQEGAWQIEYACFRCGDGWPARLTFRSEDEGATFKIVGAEGNSTDSSE